MRVISVVAGAALGLASVLAVAAEPPQAIREALLKLQPGLPIEAISESAMPGLYQVELSGGRQLYASGDGKFLIQGYLFQLKGDQAVNLTEQAESRAIAKRLATVPTAEMVIFPAKDKKTHITVFTDSDCGYCQKLHSEVPELNRRGVEVRYLAFPRQGAGSHGYRTLESVWCADDRRAAMDKAKTRQALPAASCDNPIDQQYALGQQIGVQGTPAIVLENGQMIPGYQPAPQLAQAALAAAGKAAAATR